MHFSYDNMQANCNEMQEVTNKMTENLNVINEICSRLDSGGYWTGNAYQYYSQKIKDITNQFEEVYYDLQNFILYLQQVSENYGSLDRKIMMSISNQINITEKFKR